MCGRVTWKLTLPYQKKKRMLTIFRCQYITKGNTCVSQSSQNQLLSNTTESISIPLQELNAFTQHSKPFVLETTFSLYSFFNSCNKRLV